MMLFKTPGNVEARYRYARAVTAALLCVDLGLTLFPPRGGVPDFMQGFFVGINLGCLIGMMLLLISPYFRGAWWNALYKCQPLDERELEVVARSYAAAYPLLAFAVVAMALYAIAAQDHRLWLPHSERDWGNFALFVPLLTMALPIFLARWPRMLAGSPEEDV